MICTFPDHECTCKRDDKSCELYTSSLDMYVNDKPTLTEIIETAFDTPPDPYPLKCPIASGELKKELRDEVPATPEEVGLVYTVKNNRAGK